MNCFNIRELQGILKRKFFTDLVNSSDSHKATDSTLISMRHKNNMSNILTYDQSLLYNFDLTTTSKYKNFLFSPGKVYSYSKLNYNILPNFTNNISSTVLLRGFYNLPSLLKDLLSFIYVPTLYSLTTLNNSLYFIANSILNNFYYNLPNITSLNKYYPYSVIDKEPTNSYNSSTINYNTLNNLMSSNFSENSST
jgi:hypothetical protein